MNNTFLCTSMKHFGLFVAIEQAKRKLIEKICTAGKLIDYSNIKSTVTNFLATSVTEKGLRPKTLPLKSVPH